MSSAEEDFSERLHLRYHDLNKTDCNQTRRFPIPANPLAAKKGPVPSTNELQPKPVKLPSKLPQRRRFITLAEANSARFGLNFHANLENSASLGSLAFQNALDLAVGENQEEASKQVELPAMPESKEEDVYEATEMMNMKKKRLAQFAEGPGSTLDSQKIESRFHRSSNPIRTCRFCAREFPSGRALGGHMRVHGALLFADISPYMVKQEQRSHGELETLISSDQSMDLHLSRWRQQVEQIKPSSSNCSEINSSERPNQTNKLDRHDQEDDEEEEHNQGKGEKGKRMVNLSSLESTSMASSKPVQLLAYGDASYEFLMSKKKPASAQYELRRNPKPNQRFFRDQECRSLSNAIWSWEAGGTAGSRSRSPSPDRDRERACSECGKVFLSWKALFGHMRCHPERDWRGIQPPEQQQLDRTVDRSITTTSSLAEISMAENTTRCELAGSVLSHVDSEGKPTAKLWQDGSSKNKVVDTLSAAVAICKETEFSRATQKGGICLDIAPRRFRDAAMRIEQADGNTTQRPASKKAECTSKNSTKRSTEHTDNLSSKELTTAWFPSWCTGKRSKRNWSGYSHYEPNLTSEMTSNELRLSHHDAQPDVQEEVDMANCLVLLSNAGENIQEIDQMCCDYTEGSAFSHRVKKRGDLSKGISISLQRASRAGMDAIQAYMEVDDRDYDTAAVDNAYDEVQNQAATFYAGAKVGKHGGFNAEGTYQCSTCKKCFNSHQALGGHRASHKKTKGCFTQPKISVKEAQGSGEENVLEEDFDIKHSRWQAMAKAEKLQEYKRPDGCVDPSIRVPLRKKIKGHECSICHRIFTSGQALGGHKRCHWNGERYVADTDSVASSNNKHSSVEERSEWVSESIKKLPKEETIDLNLPAPLHMEDELEATFGHMPKRGPGRKGKEEAVIAVIGYSGAGPRRQQEDWIAKESLESSFFCMTARDLEARCRFDRSPMWDQKWDKLDDVVSTQFSQVCPLKTV